MSLCGCEPGSWEKFKQAKFKDGDVVKSWQYSRICFPKGKPPLLKTIPVDNNLYKVEGEELKKVEEAEKRL